MRNIHDVLDARAVTTLFQPLIEISTGRPIGYEALSRGPAGTPWESPVALFAAAREAGREGELDWICRAQAYRTILAAEPDNTLTWFVNMEPTAARTVCPPDLAPVVKLARGRLRVVTEMTERAIARDPSGLLSAAAACRDAGWGVALDDVGADPLSLAFMPFVHPDVVKLDMQLLREPGDPHTAKVVAAVAAYAEASGAVVLAEGIETPEHLAIARTMGATIGQGWLFGRPGPLAPSRIANARMPFIPPPPVPDRRSPFEIVAARRPVLRTTKDHLMPTSRHLEALVEVGEEAPVLLACFQEARHFTRATARRFERYAAMSPLVAALGTGLAAEPVPGVRGACLDDGDALRGEWNVIVVGSHRAAALVAKDLGDTGAEGDRRFDFALTHDRALVVEAARSLLTRIAPARSATASLAAAV
ncbi:sensor domain-containing phosphodiesterase [Paractinoplanes atraurantiacus]|uniref:EAL domain, c-di-GMP-specific phosphodiesterase class I (Or its enzymatically inactive variant) n=1 Tax=Paractinoplanes atraurantiacus TaxID=1036182 RepID=A0A285I040_9ACTN|nr:EAL domain-containing protein [Actinoplanes atraurantiacus]SNY40426.1 EAL domain, c-di-GMP-specific phosphodiesterase class I (or its enzymatically inactive variant) [Actinoplanes atraurantiacus]